MTAQPASNPPGAAARPWRVEDYPAAACFEAIDGDGLVVASYGYTHLQVSYQRAQEQASFLVTAVNAFGPLVEALERVNQLLTGKFRGNHIFTTVTVGPADIALIRAALALAKGGQP